MISTFSYNYDDTSIRSPSTEPQRSRMIEEETKNMDNDAPNTPAKQNNRQSRSRKGILKHNFKAAKSIEENFETRRSQSLIDLRGDLSPFPSSPSRQRSNSSCGTKTEACDYSKNSSQESGGSSRESSSETDLYARTFPLVTSRKSRISSKQHHHQLFTSLQRLNSILIEISRNHLFNSGECDQLKCLSLTQISIPSLEEDKLSLERLSSLIDSLSEQLKSQVSNLIRTSANDKTRLEQAQYDNSSLKQRLNTALNVQQNLQGELNQLSREKKLLETENKNLAIRMVSILPSSNGGITHKRRELPQEFTGHAEDTDAECNDESDDGINNNFCQDQGSRSNISFPVESSENTFETPEEYEHEMAQDEPEREQLRSNSGLGTGKSRHDELDSITSYVKWKTVDFGRLHGKLNKNFEEMQKLKQTMTNMSQEKEEILSDLQLLVDSCRELSAERDNYESILKMILREKNSPESNLKDLLDGLLHYLSKACSTTAPASSPYHHHRHSSKCFLESALHALQEQNISLREEMTRMSEFLERTKGQNSFLKSSNEMLTVKMLDLQKQLETREEDEQRNEDAKQEKYDKMEGLYKEVLSAKNVLNEKLQEMEKELVRLNNLVEDRNKAMGEQTEKFAELQRENEKLGREVTKYKVNIEKMSQMILHLKATVRDQKGKWYERIRSSSNDLQNTKEHCKWLQTQIDNLNCQLADAHERIKRHEQDKAILAQRVLTAEEERKTLDRKILEIKSIMHGDTVYREALAERNQKLQSEVNRLRQQKLMATATESNIGKGEGEEQSVSEKINEYLRRFSGEREKKERGLKKDEDYRYNYDNGQDQDDHTNNTLDELSSIASAPLENSHAAVSPPLLSRRTRNSNSNNQGVLSPKQRKHLVDIPRAAYDLWFSQVSLHNPAVLCYRSS